jgi:hypothetical protein
MTGRAKQAWVMGALLACAVVLGIAGPARAQMGMPDARSMSGIPRPVDDLPDGSVVVLVVRGQITDALKGQIVELRAGETTRTAKSDDTGHAQFNGLTPGTAVRASTVIDGQAVQSEVFSLPDHGGVRLILAAGAASGGGAAGAPAVAGTVTFGGQSRMILEIDDDAVQVYFLLEVVNNSATPVSPKVPLVIDMPVGATDTTILEGSSPQASARGSRVTIAGPFAPGATGVQLACRLPVTSARLSFTEVLPAQFDALVVMVQKVGSVQVRSNQLANQRDVTSEGRTYIMAMGPPLAAGAPFSLDLSGLPYRSATPTRIALALAVLLLGGGAWAAARSGASRGADTARRELEARRERVFGEFVRLEQQSRAGRVNPDQYREHRDEMMGQLERIYGELDTAGGQGEEGQTA